MDRRRFVRGVGMVTGLGVLGWGNMLGANQAPEPPPTPAEATPHPWVEKKHEFDMYGEHWHKVFDRLADLSGKPVISSYMIAGSLWVRTRRGVKYSILDIINLINEGLQFEELRYKYVLLNRQRSFAFFPVSRGIDPRWTDSIIETPHGAVSMLEMRPGENGRLVTIAVGRTIVLRWIPYPVCPR
jgi:hypothetical protein